MVLTLQRFINKPGIVTGISSGIGAAITKRLVKEGLIVVGLARRIDIIKELSEKLKNEKGKLYPIQADITNEEDILKSFNFVTENLGPIHVLINNAGVSKPVPLSLASNDDLKSVLNTNVLGLNICTREAIKNMRENNVKGHVINMNSIAGHKVPLGASNINIYPASKFAVTALTETWRQELNFLGSKIKISSISPGLVTTEMTTEDKKHPEHAARMKHFPALTPEDVANAVVYVLSTPEHVQIHELTIKPVGEKH